MYCDINRMLVEEKMKEMRQYALASNLTRKKNANDETLKQRRAVNLFTKRKVG